MLPGADVDIIFYCIVITVKKFHFFQFQVSFQLSAMLRPDTSFPLLDSINSTRLVPLFWASEGFSQPNSWMISHTKMALEMPVVASLGCAGGLLGLGLCFLVIWLWKRNH